MVANPESMGSAPFSFDQLVVEAVEKVGPAVVNISTVRLIRDFFHVHPLQGVGSGVIVNPSGFIVTNRHVIEASDRVTVALGDGRKFEGHVAGADATSDIAVVKIEGNDLPTAELGDSDAIKVGQMAIAIGNPFGMILGGPTVTTGVISAINRHIQAEDRIIENLIQTDAAINPGNSGGPLVDSSGKVVGINTAMIPYAQGIGFAIPINPVKQIIEDLILYGKAIRPWLGFVGFTLTEEVARYYELPVAKGVVVARVVPYGPADKAGLQDGDIILALNAQELASIGELQRLVQKSRVGERISLTLLRAGRTLVGEVVLGEVPQS